MPHVTTTDLTTPTGPVPIPTVGFGVWQVPDDEVDAAVVAALDAGYRHVDTARLYGNEAGVGLVPALLIVGKLTAQQGINQPHPGILRQPMQTLYFFGKHIPEFDGFRPLPPKVHLRLQLRSVEARV